MNWLLLIRGEEILALLLAALGGGLGIYFARDNWRDAEVYQAEGWNGFAALTATIGMRSGLAKAWLHFILAFLPVLSLVSTPSSQRYAAALIFYLLLCMAQSGPITMQVLNERDRRRLRRSLSRTETAADKQQ